jgi:RNA recognition motif-containing protein
VKSTVSENELRETFEQCGPVHRIQIRCSKGAAVNVGGHFPGRLSTDRLYATVEYKNPSSAAQALQLNGKSLQGVRVVVRPTYSGITCSMSGRPLKVCSDPQDLPERQQLRQRPISETLPNRFSVIPFLKRRRKSSGFVYLRQA